MSSKLELKCVPYEVTRDCFCLLWTLLLSFMLSCRALCADGMASWSPLTDFEKDLGPRRAEVSALRDKVAGKKGTIPYEKAEEAWRKGNLSEGEKRYNEAWELYGLAIKWYRKALNRDLKEPSADSYSKEFLAYLERMKGRLREWEGVKGKIRVFLSREAVEKWFAELDGEPQARMATAERRRICIVWLLSLYSMIDYAELAPSLCEKVMKQGEFEDAFNEFSKNISDNVSYIRWKNCFEDFMKEWAELMKSHYLDGEIERELLEFLRKRMDFLRNMSNYYLVRDPFPEYEEWMKAQMTKSENIMTESK